MRKHDELRRLHRTLGHRKQGAHTELFHCGAIEDFNLQAALTRERLCLVRKKGWRADIGG